MSNSFYIAFSIVAQICATMLFFSCASLRYKVYNENKLTKELSAYIVDMVYIDNPSIIEFSNVLDKKTGETYSDYTFDDNAKAQDFKEVVIVIYEKVIKDNIQNEEFYRDSGFSTSDIIGTVAAHEGEHGTNKKVNSGFVSEEEAETKALNSEKKAIDDLKKLNNKASR